MIKALTLAVGLAAVAAPLSAQSILDNCNTYENAQRLLIDDFDEWPAWRGLISSNQAVIQMWLNLETRTWSLMSVFPDGRACIFADGLAFDILDEPVRGEPM
jgi:hypothetical protein